MRPLWGTCDRRKSDAYVHVQSQQSQDCIITEGLTPSLSSVQDNSSQLHDYRLTGQADSLKLMVIGNYRFFENFRFSALKF